MNLLDDGSRKKKLIIAGVVALVVILLAVIFMFRSSIVELVKGKDEPEVVKSKEEDEGGGGQGLNPNYDFDELVDIDFIVPSNSAKGVISSYTDYSTQAEIEVTLGKNKKKYNLFTNSIVFDAKSNSVELPSTLANAKEVRIMSRQGDTIDTADVVILNDQDNLSYTPVMRLSENGNYTQILNLSTKTKYNVQPDAPMTNALSGEVYEKEDLKPGDRVFVYTVKKDESKQEETQKDGELEVIEANPVEGSQDTSDFKDVEVSSVYVYPFKINEAASQEE